MDKPYVFISHISQEVQLAELFKSQIAQDFLGMIEVFVSSDGASISVGSKWLNDIDAALKNAKVELIICSEDSVKRPWINFEAGAGWVKGIPIVPVCHTGLRPVDLPVPLNMLQGIEAADPTGLKRIYTLLAKQLGCNRPKQSFTKFVKAVQAFEREYSTVREVRQYAGEFQNALVLEDLQCEPDPEGWATLFRLGVRNAHSHKTIENVCIRVVSLVSVDGNDRRERLPFTRPLLAITGTGRMPSSPPETSRSLVASDSVFFDFVRVHSHRKAGHSLRYGECVKDWPSVHQDNERWKLTHDAFLDPGKYKVTIEVQGRDFVPVRKQFVFWGDKTGQHCVDANDPSAQSTEPLEFASIDLDTLPAEMHPHQLRALKAELRKPEYDGMSAEAAYRKIDKDKTMCGLSQVRFVTSAELEQTPLKKGKWALIVSEEEMSRFPSGIPGFPNAIRRSDFDIAWQAVRRS